MYRLLIGIVGKAGINIYLVFKGVIGNENELLASKKMWPRAWGS
jgi:hypothetical protein